MRAGKPRFSKKGNKVLAYSYDGFEIMNMQGQLLEKIAFPEGYIFSLTLIGPQMNGKCV